MITINDRGYDEKTVQLFHHEAGHVVMSWALDEAPVSEICMVKSTNFDAHVRCNVADLGRDADTFEKARLLGLRFICVTMAGPLAEFIAGATLEEMYSTDPNCDFEKCYRIAGMIVPDREPMPFVARTSSIVMREMMRPIWDGVAVVAGELSPGIIIKGDRLQKLKADAMAKVDTKPLPRNWTAWRRLLRQCR
jgi:hypothetical protein